MAGLLADAADPFGLWEPAEKGAADGAGAESFAVPGDGASGSQGLAWSLNITSGADASAALDARERQVRAMEAGLEQAEARAERALARHRAAAQGQPVSFSIEEPQAERDLMAALAQLDPGERPASFGLEFSQVDWAGLKRQFDAFMDLVNRQVLHYAWVETNLNGEPAARTAMRWGGDLNTYLRPELGRDIAEAHTQSMTLALAARAANLRTAISVMQIAAKIAVAVTTPIGVAQALALAWQFVFDVIVPLLEEARRQS